MSIKTTLAAAAIGAMLAIPITAGAVAQTDSPEVDTPCGLDSEWMQQQWNDPAHRDEMRSYMEEHWDEMQSLMEEHWDEMQSLMEEHWDEMGPHMFSDDFDHGPGMMGGFGMRGPATGGYGMWRGSES